MDLDDLFDPKVIVAVAVTAAVTSPPVRKALRQGAVYGMAGLLMAADRVHTGEQIMDDAGPNHDGQGNSQEYDAAIRRAEQLVDRAAEAVAVFAARCGHEFRRLAARTREEAEDMWAEAQALRDAQRSRE